MHNWRACRWRFAPELPLWESWTQCLARARFHVEQFLPDEMVYFDGTCKAAPDGQVFSPFDHPNFELPVLGYAGVPDRPSTQTGFGTLSTPLLLRQGCSALNLMGDCVCNQRSRLSDAQSRCRHAKTSVYIPSRCIWELCAGG
jgi:hypothetical protein